MNMVIDPREGNGNAQARRARALPFPIPMVKNHVVMYPDDFIPFITSQYCSNSEIVMADNAGLYRK